MYPVLESIFVGIATFAVGTYFQGATPFLAGTVAVIGGLTYLGISEAIDAHCRR